MNLHCDDYSALTLADQMLRRHEGLRLKPYECTQGYQTIGYGRNLDSKGITRNEAEAMLTHDIQEARDDLANLEYWGVLSSRRKAALIDMRFCVGPKGFRDFKRMHRALCEGDYEKAANEMLDSVFARQVGLRASELADMVRVG